MHWRRSGVEPRRQICRDCGFIVFRNSKPCVAALITRRGGNELLLARRAVKPYQGWWDLPGGFLESGEPPEAGLRREIGEETGLAIGSVKLLGISMDTYGPDGDPTLNMHYQVEAVGVDEVDMVVRSGDDVSELAWFTRDRLPGSIAFKNCREAVERWRDGK